MKVFKTSVHLCLVLFIGVAAVNSGGCEIHDSPQMGSRRQHHIPITENLDLIQDDRFEDVHGGTEQFENSLSTPMKITLDPGEELWVIAKSDKHADSQRQQNDDALPGSGALLTFLPGKKQPQSDDSTPENFVPIPLKHTNVQANILGYISTVDVTQQFHNPWSTKIEAVYVFPLPENAAVNQFVMTIGDRRIRGVIRERKEAQQLYQHARAHGHVASLLTQERPNIFTQKVANIESGKNIDISIRYFHTLQYNDGYYEFVFPMVVGPRYNPPATADRIIAAPRGTIADADSSDTTIPYLRPNERNGHNIALAVHLNAGVALESIESVNHRIAIAHPQQHSEYIADNEHNEPNDPFGQSDDIESGKPRSQAFVQLSAEDTIPNKDFVLRFRVAGERMKGNMLVHRDADGQGYFTLMLYPPAELDSLQRQPMEMVFVIDSSGSMRGEPVNQVKAAIMHALDLLDKDDTFQIIRFANDAMQLGQEPLPATLQNIQRAKVYVQNIIAGGGTNTLTGINASFGMPYGPDRGTERQRIVTFMTDGFIGNESEILQAITMQLGPARIFSFGVGSSPNRYLLNSMAILGKGAVAYLSLNDDAAYVMNQYFNRVSRPVLTNIRLDWNGLHVDADDMYPRQMPDLFVGKPAVITGRFAGRLPDKLRITGHAAGRLVEMDVPVVEGAYDSRRNFAAIKPVWGRLKIQDLAMQLMREPENNPLQQEIENVALRHQLMSQYTAFIAIDSSRATEGDYGTSVAVPVPVPDGVKYETTVPETITPPNPK